MLAELGLSRAQLAQLLGVDPRTVQRWLTGQTQPPPYAMRLVRLVALGELGAIDPAFDGWVLRGGRLVLAGTRLAVSPGELAMVPQLWGLALSESHRPRQLELFAHNGPQLAAELGRRLR